MKKRGPRPKVFAEYRASTVIRGRVARKAPGGNISKFKVTTVVGNGKGWAGVGDAQSTYSGREARTKAIVDAMKGMFYIERYRGKTVYHGVKTKLGATKVDLWPKREGSGVHGARQSCRPTGHCPACCARCVCCTCCVRCVLIRGHQLT